MRIIDSTQTLVALQIDVDLLCEPTTSFLKEAATCAVCKGSGGVGLIHPQLMCAGCKGRGCVTFASTPPLLDQLQWAVGNGGEQSSGHQPPGPRLPLDTHALAVSVEIRVETAAAMRAAGDMRDHHRLARLVRMWAGHGGEWAATDSAELTRAQEQAASWVRAVRGVLGQAPAPARGRWRGRCPECGLSSIAECARCPSPRFCGLGARDHEHVRRPALIFDSDAVVMSCANPTCDYTRTGADLAYIASAAWSAAS
jgi:hypothetical protein